MKPVTILAVDAGLCGAMLLVRSIGKGPEVMRVPCCWRSTRLAWEKRVRGDVEGEFVYLLQRYKPQVVAMEKPVSILGRKGVGVSQGEHIGRFSLLAQQAKCKPRIVLVPGQRGSQAMKAATILRQSLSEIVSREELATLNRVGSREPGEHYADCCAIALRALSDYEKGAGDGDGSSSHLREQALRES